MATSGDAHPNCCEGGGLGLGEQGLQIRTLPLSAQAPCDLELSVPHFPLLQNGAKLATMWGRKLKEMKCSGQCN